MGKKQLYSYIFWGVLSTVLNIALAQFTVWCGVDYKIANIITLVVVKIFCYFTNKFFVFKTPFESFSKFTIESIRFIFARLLTFLGEYFGVIGLVEIVQISFFFSKSIMSAIVIVLNYILSKKLVFRKQKTSNNMEGYR